MASPEGNLFVWLESWRATGGEDRGRATMRASELLTEAAKQTLGLESRKSGFAPEMLYSAWGVFRKWIEEDSERREYLLRRVEPLVQEFRNSADKAALFRG